MEVGARPKRMTRRDSADGNHGGGSVEESCRRSDVGPGILPARAEPLGTALLRGAVTAPASKRVPPAAKPRKPIIIIRRRSILRDRKPAIGPVMNIASDADSNFDVDDVHFEAAGRELADSRFGYQVADLYAGARTVVS
jgi:hypothetical protein